ncbi:MAG: hypothetical protein WC521_08765 [Bdellovibrionales bacterium]|jgi:hypothetical protein
MSEDNQPIIKYSFGNAKEPLTLPSKVFSGESVSLKSLDGSHEVGLVVRPTTENNRLVQEFLAKKFNRTICSSEDQPIIKCYSDDEPPIDGPPILALSGDVFSGDFVRLVGSQEEVLVINPTYENIMVVQDFMAKLLGIKKYFLPKDYLKDVGFIQETGGDTNAEITAPDRKSLVIERDEFYKGRGAVPGYG